MIQIKVVLVNLKFWFESNQIHAGQYIFKFWFESNQTHAGNFFPIFIHQGRVGQLEILIWWTPRRRLRVQSNPKCDCLTVSNDVLNMSTSGCTRRQSCRARVFFEKCIQKCVFNTSQAIWTPLKKNLNNPILKSNV